MAKRPLREPEPRGLRALSALAVYGGAIDLGRDGTVRLMLGEAIVVSSDYGRKNTASVNGRTIHSTSGRAVAAWLNKQRGAFAMSDIIGEAASL